MNLSPTIKRFIPPIVSLASLMEGVDTTIINTAIPSMAESLKVNPIDLKIALISYLLSLAIFMPISGWLADKYGIKKVFITALGIFTLSSLACGYAHQIGELVIARTFQGLGGALMMPIGRLMIVRWFDRTEFIQTMNRVIMVALIGPALGPVLGGWITQTFSWRWIFWVNIPFGILNILLAFYLLPEYRAEKIPPLDKIGFLLFGLGLAGMTFGLSALSEQAMGLPLIGGIMVFSLILLLFYLFYSQHQKFPILNNALFQLRTFRLAILGNLVTRVGFSGLPFLLPLMLQLCLHYSPALSGAILIAIPAGSFLAKTFSRRLMKILGFKSFLISNTVLMACALLLFSTITANISLVLIFLYSLIFGIVAALQYSGMNPLVFAEPRPHELSNATSIHGVTIQIAQSIGVAICALLLMQFSQLSHGLLLNITDFHYTFLALSFITLLSTSVFLFLQKEDGANLIKPINA